jgi:hypothetical protein
MVQREPEVEPDNHASGAIDRLVPLDLEVSGG